MRPQGSEGWALVNPHRLDRDVAKPWVRVGPSHAGSSAGHPVTRGAGSVRQWLILLPTSETKDVTSNMPCSFNNSLEVCHPWLCLNLFEAIFKNIAHLCQHTQWRLAQQDWHSWLLDTNCLQLVCLWHPATHSPLVLCSGDSRPWFSPTSTLHGQWVSPQDLENIPNDHCTS